VHSRRQLDNWDTNQGETPYSSMDMLFDYLEKPGKLALYTGGTYRGKTRTKREWAKEASEWFLTTTYPRNRDPATVEAKVSHPSP